MQKNGFSKEELNETPESPGYDSSLPAHGKGYVNPEKSGGEVSYQDKKEAGYKSLKPSTHWNGRVEPGTTINLNDLSLAIANKIGIDIEEARRDAGFVLDVTWPHERTIDNVLDPEDRQLFYILEEEGMVSTEREEFNLYDGREWRVFWWKLNKETIIKYANGVDTKKHKIPIKPSEESELGEVYGRLDKEWSSRKNNGGDKVPPKPVKNAYNSGIEKKIRERQT